MYKVVLVDDEIFVRQGIKSLIEWNKLGYEIVGEAGNGEDAFEVIKETKPDVVISDIRMPVVDGLSLIQNINEKLDLNVHFIIISGYNDFSYAQKAVRFGVFDYVLKPIDQEEMESTLEKLSQKISKEKIQQSNKGRLLLDQLFMQTLDGQLQDQELQNWMKSLKLNESSYYYYAAFEINNLLPEEQETVGELFHTIKNLIHDMVLDLSNGQEQLAVYEQQDNTLGLLITSSFINKSKKTLEDIVEKIRKKVEKRVQKPITCFVGKQVTELKTTRFSYDTANSIRFYKYINKEDTLFVFEEVESLALVYNEIPDALYVSLMDQIEENNHDQMDKFIDQIFNEFQEKKFAPEAIRTSINRCIHSLIKTVNKMEGDEKSIPSLSLMTNWEKYNLTFGELKKMFFTFMLDGAKLIQELRKDNMKGDIYKVKSFVDSNFHENISLKSIASKFYMNPVYMGQLFKKTFGIYFKEYLLKLRIEEAKKLLRQTDLRVYEVAERVGFGSTDYFVTQFEKINKLTPTEYRNELLKK